MLKILRNFLLLWSLVLLQACAGLGTPPIDTFNKRMAAAYVTVQTVADGTLILVKAGKINKMDGLRLRDQLENAMEGLRTARVIAKTDMIRADDRLSAAIAILSALQIALAAHQEAAK